MRGLGGGRVRVIRLDAFIPWIRWVDQDSGLLIRVGQSLWMGLPLILTGNLHMFVVKHDWFSGLRRPLDGGRSLRGRRLIGDHKTWRGVFVMTVFAGLFGALAGFAGGAWAAREGVAPIRYEQVLGGSTPLWWAANYAVVNGVLGLAYVLGELPNSIVKRRVGVPPGIKVSGVRGGFFAVVDHADSVLAVLLVAVWLFGLPWRTFAVALPLLVLVHFAFNAGLYAARVKRNL